MNLTDKASQPAIRSILMVDTDSMSCELLQFRFESEGFHSVIMTDGRKALQTDLTRFCLIIVDLMDQEFNGFEFTKAVRRNPDTFNIPVTILTARASEDNIVDGLDAGADDFLPKPYSLRVLLARIHSVIRRKQAQARSRRAPAAIRFRDLVLDVAEGTVTLNGEPLQLTRTEYLILAMFIRNAGSFFERFEIKHEAWDNESEVSDRAVDTNISRIRKKLGEYGRYLVNRQGFGYGLIE